MPIDEPRAANRANWDDRVPIHMASREYDRDGFVADPARLSDVVAFDAERVGDVRGLDLVHLQCHFGLDTLSWARLGARVTGLDFSAPAIAAARELAAECGIDARFVEAELYDAPQAIEERFDIVYTGVGALCWLPDIRGWARVVAEMLRPGGQLYIRDGHPMLNAIDDERTDDLLVVDYPYFEGEPFRWEETRSYTDGEGRMEHAVTYQWSHGLGETVTALLDAGLRLTRLDEYREAGYKALHMLEPCGGGRWKLPERDLRLPMMFAIGAVKD